MKNDEQAKMLDDSRLEDSPKAFWTLARKLWLPIFFLVTVLLNWDHPIELAMRSILFLLSTKPSPLSVYLPIEKVGRLLICVLLVSILVLDRRASLGLKNTIWTRAWPSGGPGYTLTKIHEVSGRFLSSAPISIKGENKQRSVEMDSYKFVVWSVIRRVQGRLHMGSSKHQEFKFWKILFINKAFFFSILLLNIL